MAAQRLKRLGQFAFRFSLILSILAALLLLPKPCSAQGSAISGQVITTQGYPAANVPVRVCAYTSTGNPCTPTANIYSDPALTQQIGNPYSTDQYGNYSLFVAAGYYIVQITPSAGVTYSYLVSSNGSASVSSVGLAMPSIFTVTGSPVTGSGTLTASLNNETANTVFAGPNGSTGVPTFRPLVVADLPALSASNLTNGTTGTGAIVLATSPTITTATLNSPTLVTPDIGVATGTSLTVTSNVISTGGGAQMSANQMNANTYFTINGATGSSGQCLLSGGGSGPDTWGSCTGTTYYQTMAANGTGQTQRPTLNFSPRFGLTDSASPAETTVDLANTVSAGSCTICSVTYDAYGRITAASSGATTVVKSAHLGAASCSPPGGSFSTCTSTVSWPSAFADTNYYPVCFGGAPGGGGGSNSILLYVDSYTTTGVTVLVQNNSSDSGTTLADIYCIGAHN